MASSSKKVNRRYFLYSQIHVNEQNDVLAKIGKEFVCGTVVYGNNRKEFSVMSTTPSMGSRYPDCKIIAEGVIDGIHYTLPSTRTKKL